MQIARIGSVSWVIAGGVGFFDMCLLISMLRPHTHTTTPPPCLPHSGKQPSVACEGSCSFWNEVILELNPVRVVVGEAKEIQLYGLREKKKFVQKWTDDNGLGLLRSGGITLS